MASAPPLNATHITAPVAPVLFADDHELGELLDAHRSAAYNLAYRILGRPEDAADAVQDAFLRAVRAMRGNGAAPREPERFQSWLLRIVSNAAVDQLRQRARRPVGSLGDLAQAVAAGDRGQPAYELDRREQRSSILRALFSLPATQRAALTLREYQGLSYDEIGTELGLTQAATTMLLFRARTAFRAAYEGTKAGTASAGCPELAPLLSALLDGELDREAWHGVDRHLKRCDRCRRELRGLRRSRRLYAAIPLLVPPAGWGYAALTSAATVEAAGVIAASTAAVPVVAPAIAPAIAPVVAPAVGLGATTGAGGMLGAVGSFLSGKVAAIAVAAGVTVATTMSPGATELPAVSAAQEVTTPATQRQSTRPIEIAMPMLDGTAPATPPEVSVAASTGPVSDEVAAEFPADRLDGQPTGPADVEPAPASAPPVAAASGPLPPTESSARPDGDPPQIVTSAPADREDRAVTARASDNPSSPALEVAATPADATDPTTGSAQDTPTSADPPGQAKVEIGKENGANGQAGNGQAGNGQAGNGQAEEMIEDDEQGQQVGEQPDAPGPPEQADGNGPPGHASGGGPPEGAADPPAQANGPPEHANGNGPPDQANGNGPPAQSNGNGPPEHAHGPAARGNAEPKREPPGQAAAHAAGGPPPHAKPGGGNLRASEAEPPDNSSEPADDGPPARPHQSPPSHASKPDDGPPPAKQSNDDRQKAEQPPAESRASGRKQPADDQSAPEPPKQQEKKDAPEPKSASEKSAAEAPKQSNKQDAGTSESKNKPEPPKSASEAPKQSSKQETGSSESKSKQDAGASESKSKPEPPKSASSKEPKSASAGDSKPSKKP